MIGNVYKKFPRAKFKDIIKIDKNRFSINLYKIQGVYHYMNIKGQYKRAAKPRFNPTSTIPTTTTRENWEITTHADKNPGWFNSIY